MNFELILVIAVLVTGGIWGLDKVFFASKRQQKTTEGYVAGKEPILVEYARSFFPILLIVLLLRSFLLEPFRVPTGSLEPTVLPGDFILVNKYHYGLRLPVTHTKFLTINEPKIGDIVVFHYPPNPTIDYVKRVVGVSGDSISYINKVLYINGKEAPQEFQKSALDIGDAGLTFPVSQKLENLNGVKHGIYQRNDVSAADFHDVVVPVGYYFMMGDNRDDSIDSRYWGFVPEENIVGKAFMIWLSWDSQKTGVRWRRIGTRFA